MRPEPVMYPCEPTVLFDALVAHFPDTDQQVTWADRQLGMISGICNGRRGGMYSPNRFTIYLRSTPDGRTLVTIHVEAADRLGGVKPVVDPIRALVAHVAGGVSELR